ncbi:hypothetical protein G6655_02860 [Polynucleobacter paneuropaeus]|nr:hypothetical protein [Polynucleobacter paneuropaeus]
MAMTLHPIEHNGFRITQEFQHPAVYLDHWAIRHFAENLEDQDRFIKALHRSHGLWLFSTANLFEFVAMTDISQAEDVERLIQRALPFFHLAEFAVDKGYIFEEGSFPGLHGPQKDWYLDDLAARASIVDGRWNTHRFIQDAISHREQLLPLFQEMKCSISAAVMSLTKDPQKTCNAKKFIPKAGMSLRGSLFQELLREPHVDEKHKFKENDAMDFLHAFSSVLTCDFVLLDAAWCHKVQSAASRISSAGIKGHIAHCFSKKSVNEFLIAFEAEVA